MSPSRKSPSTILVSFAAAAILIAAVAVSQLGTARPVQGADTASQEKQQFASIMTDEAAQMYYWLRIATGENVPCGPGCEREESFDQVMWGLVARCEKVDPSAQFSAPAYDAALSSRMLTALQGACNALTAGKATLGEPRDSAEWRAKAAEAKAVLKTVEANLQ